MEKTIHFFRTIVIDAELQAKILLTLLHVPIIVILVFLFKELLFLRRANTYRRNLLFILDDFAAFCTKHYHEALRVVALIQPGKPENYEDHLLELSQPMHINQLLQKIVQNPEVLLSQKVNLKVSSRLAVLADRIQYRHRFMNEYVKDFLAEYKESERKYFQHLSQLAMLHDNLSQGIAGKTYNSDNVKQWVTGYLEIFRDWFENGASKELTRSYKEIVKRVMLLNKIHRDIPLAFNAHENAVSCEMIYMKLSRMNSDLIFKLNQFASFHRMGWRLTRFVIEKVIFKKRKAPAVGAFTYIERKMFSSLNTQMQTRILDLNLKPLKFMGKKLLIYSAVLLLLVSAIVLAFATWKPALTKKLSLVSKADTAIQVTYQSEKQSKPADTIAAATKLVKAAAPDSSVYGIDISRYQGNLLDDLDNMDTLHFVLCKATEGSTYTDPLFASNFEYLQKKGLIRGAYHFYRNDVDALKQARHFLKIINGYGAGELPPVVDVEDGSLIVNTDVKMLQRHLLKILAFIEKKIKTKPIIYTNLYFADEYLANDSFATYPLWLAEYSKGKTPRLPTTWRRKGEIIWQRSDTYSVDSRRVDFDIYHGTMKQLRQFIDRCNRSTGK